MKDEIGDMVSSGMKTIKLIIDHEGQPGQRKPESTLYRAEGPKNAFPCQSGPDMIVIGDIDAVIKIDEIKLTHLPVDSQCDNRQKNIYKNFLSLRTDIHFI